MKKYLLMLAALATMLSFNACNENNRNNEPDDPEQTGEVLTPEQTKEKMMNIANGLIGKFKTADQQQAIQLMDDMVKKYENYDFEPIGQYFDNRYDVLFEAPRYLCAVANGENPAPAVNHAYTFSFEGESVIWEADERNHTWINKGAATDNSIIMRAKDPNGTMCEAKFWGTGATKTYEVTWTEDGQNYSATGVFPETVHFTFKHGNTLLASADLKQDMQRNHHATFNMDALVVNLRWTADLDIRSTSGTMAFAFFYDTDSLLSALVHLPSYKLINKDNSTTADSYEDWIEEYEDRYDELIRQIGDADGIVNIHGQAQGKINISNAGQAYASIRALDDNGVDAETQEGANQYCTIINGAQTNGIYFGTSTKQADVRMIASSDGEYYWPEPVLYFPSDKTSYSFEQYFDRKPFTDLEQSLENLINSYIQLSSWLYDEAGLVDF